MPFWPFLMGATAYLCFRGWQRGSWLAPATVFVGYVLASAVIYAAPVRYVEVSMCALWLSISGFLIYKSEMVPGLLLTLSALTYPVLLLFGFRVEYMGLAPFVSDGLAILALIFMGRGINGLDTHTNTYSFGVLRRPHVDYTRVALCEVENHDVNR